MILSIKLRLKERGLEEYQVVTDGGDFAPVLSCSKLARAKPASATVKVFHANGVDENRVRLACRLKSPLK